MINIRIVKKLHYFETVFIKHEFNQMKQVTFTLRVNTLKDHYVNDLSFVKSVWKSFYYTIHECNYYLYFKLEVKLNKLEVRDTVKVIRSVKCTLL